MDGSEYLNDTNYKLLFLFLLLSQSTANHFRISISGYLSERVSIFLKSNWRNRSFNTLLKFSA